MDNDRAVIAAAAAIVLAICCEEAEEEEVRANRKRKREVEISNAELFKELKMNDPLDVKNYMTMDEKTYEILLDLVKHKITKQDTLMRSAIPAEMRLGITLRFLATGNSYEDLKFVFAVSPNSIGKIVMETCDAINVALKSYIKIPKTSDEWLKESDNFFTKSKFVHCLGAIDGKHIKIRKPPHSGSNFFNYEKSFSIVLMAIVNSHSEFLMVDLGTNGRISDDVVLNNTKFFQKLLNNELKLPQPAPVIGDILHPYVFVAGDAFDLRTNIMKPYTQSGLTEPQLLFNKRLSSARAKVENAFSILAARFRVLHTTIALSPEKTGKVVLSCCYLHNFLKRALGAACTASSLEETNDNTLLSLQPTYSQNAHSDAKAVRSNLCEAMHQLNTQ